MRGASARPACFASRDCALQAEHGACKPIDVNGVYLCDTGGQYVDGTTDTTRTLRFGSLPASKDEKRGYTRVLQVDPMGPHRARRTRPRCVHACTLLTVGRCCMCAALYDDRN